MNWFQRIFHRHHGPVIKVSQITYTNTSDEIARPLGTFTRRICRCRKCGKIFTASELPGHWTLDEAQRNG